MYSHGVFIAGKVKVESKGRTRREKGSLSSNRSVDFWYLRISRRARVPGLYRRGFRGTIPFL